MRFLTPLLILLFISKSLSNFYCGFCDGKHTLCQYANQSKNCVNSILTKFDPKDRQRIVRIHNNYRNIVALGKGKGLNTTLPPASNMLKLKWDFELQTMAEKWALQCIPCQGGPQNDFCRVVSRFDVGQNVRVVFSNKIHFHIQFPDLIESWYFHIKKFNFYNFEKYIRYLIDEPLTEMKTNLRHFTQMMYAPVQYIGCAEIIYPTKVGKGARTKFGIVKRFICNYAPRYFHVDRLYIPGEPCTGCPENYGCFSRPFPGLCTKKSFRTKTKTETTTENVSNDPMTLESSISEEDFYQIANKTEMTTEFEVSFETTHQPRTNLRKRHPKRSDNSSLTFASLANDSF